MPGKNIPRSVPKNKRCQCGKEITHHHFSCNECWKENKKTNRLRKKAMEKNKSGV